ERMRRALSEYVVAGIKTNLEFHEEILTHPAFLDGSYDTQLIPEMMKTREAPEPKRTEIAELAAVLQKHIADEAVASGATGASAAGRTDGASSASTWKTLGRLAQRRRF
ncbi:MAG: hypothetical protein AAGI01_14535, partial [Myxococcota bacterium]